MPSPSTEKNSDRIEDYKKNKSSSPSSPITLHNPTPIHPKANQIISFPETMATVIIHFPEYQNEPAINDLITNGNNLKTFTV
jgi:hypothetical protein